MPCGPTGAGRSLLISRGWRRHRRQARRAGRHHHRGEGSAIRLCGRKWVQDLRINLRASAETLATVPPVEVVERFHKAGIPVANMVKPSFRKMKHGIEHFYLGWSSQTLCKSTRGESVPFSSNIERMKVDTRRGLSSSLARGRHHHPSGE